MRRCEACGRFFDGDECPGDHSHIESYVPPEYAEKPLLEPPPTDDPRGRWTTIQIDGEECPAMYVARDRIVVFGPGTHGHVHVTTLEEGA
jgi:hypothetical protein